MVMVTVVVEEDGRRGSHHKRRRKRDCRREWCVGVCLVKTDDDNVVEDEERGTQLSRNAVFESVAAAAHSSR